MKNKLKEFFSPMFTWWYWLWVSPAIALVLILFWNAKQ